MNPNRIIMPCCGQYEENCDCNKEENAEKKALKEHFEANMLDGQKVNDCGKAMLSAESVLEYINENFSLPKKRH